MATDSQGLHVVRAETPRGNIATWRDDYRKQRRLVSIESDVGTVLLIVDRDASAYDVDQLLADVENEIENATGSDLR